MVVRVVSSGSRARQLGLAGVALVALGCESSSSSSNTVGDPTTYPAIRTLSNRADLISGGDALLEIALPPGREPSQLRVQLGAMDVTSQFAVRAGGRIIGLVTGLADGANTISADLGSNHGSYLVVVNHPIGGPVIAGPQVKPFVCATPTEITDGHGLVLSNASGLSTPASDEQCNIASEARLFYRTSGPCNPVSNPDPVPGPAPDDACFKPYDPAALPADVAMTTTDTGVTMPYIVRVERGTLDRGIYDIAVLFDPSTASVKTGWSPTAPQPGWNGKVVYSFGASSGQPRLQFHSEQRWADETALARGFLVVIHSLTDSLYNSNRVAMTEAVMMMKEKIIDGYGEIRYVIGNGCSGGSINQLTAASIYPGLIDGIQPTCTYPDSETTAIEVADCTLLVGAYNAPRWQALMAGKTALEINAKKAAINGHVDQTGCHAWVNSFSNLGRPGNYVAIGVVDDLTGAVGPIAAGMTNNCRLPAAMVYDPVTNKTGVRCTGEDHAAAILGTVTDPATGVVHARSTRDNVGVQYGLQAFLSGGITAEEFVTLNEVIGGIDFDNNATARRSTADPEALAVVYRAGIVSDGGQLAKTPILDLRGFDDTRAAAFGIHHVWRSFALRARLDAANGNHANHVMWRFGPALVAPPASGLTLQSFLMMDQWLAAMKSDTMTAAIEARVAAHRPAGAVDFCYLSSDAAFTRKITDAVLCDADPFLKPHRSPRQVAGGPVAENVLKCQLRPIQRADYDPIGVTDDQLARLAAVFPDGVCDYTKPGVGQQPAISPLDFSAGPGGVPLPPAPQTRAF